MVLFAVMPLNLQKIYQVVLNDETSMFVKLNIT